MSNEQLLLEHWRNLPDELQREVVDFAEFLSSKQTLSPKGAGSQKDKPKNRFSIPGITGKIQIVGDIVGPIVDEEDWECLK